MFKDYQNYITRIRDNLIQCGVSLPYSLTGDLETYRELFNVCSELEDILYFYKIMELSDSEHKLNGFFLPLNETYIGIIRDLAYREFLDLLPSYKKLLGEEDSCLVDINPNTWDDDEDEDAREDWDEPESFSSTEFLEEREAVESSGQFESETTLETKTYETVRKEENYDYGGLEVNPFLAAIQGLGTENEGDETPEIGTKEDYERGERDIETYTDEEEVVLSDEEFAEGFFSNFSSEDENSTLNICTSENTPKEYVSTGVLFDGDTSDFPVNSSMVYVSTGTYIEDLQDDSLSEEVEGIEYIDESNSYTSEPVYLEDIQDVDSSVSYTDIPVYIEDLSEHDIDDTDELVDDGFEYVDEPEFVEVEEEYLESEPEYETDEDGFEIVDELETVSVEDDEEDEDFDGLEYVETDEDGFEVIDDDGLEYVDEEEFEDIEENDFETDENGFEVVDDDGLEYVDDEPEYADSDDFVDDTDLDENGFEVIDEPEYQDSSELEEEEEDEGDGLEYIEESISSSDSEELEVATPVRRQKPISKPIQPQQESPQDLSDFLTEKTNAALTEVKKSFIRATKKWFGS